MWACCLWVLLWWVLCGLLVCEYSYGTLVGILSVCLIAGVYMLWLGFTLCGFYMISFVCWFGYDDFLGLIAGCCFDCLWVFMACLFVLCVTLLVDFGFFVCVTLFVLDTLCVWLILLINVCMFGLCLMCFCLIPVTWIGLHGLRGCLLLWVYVCIGLDCFIILLVCWWLFWIIVVCTSGFCCFLLIMLVFSCAGMVWL